MTIKRSVEMMLSEVEAKIETWPCQRALAAQQAGEAVIVDIRDSKELEQQGTIAGALHAPRGLLELMIDPVSPHHHPVFASGKRFVFFCAGGVRSALATQTAHEMGLAPVCHIAGGFAAWREAGLPVAPFSQPGSSV